MMEAAYTVRRAVPQDAPDILRITKLAFSNYANMAGLKTVDALHETIDCVLRDIETKLVLVACQQEKIVGSVRIAIDGKYAYLSRYGVIKSNIGIGKALFQSVDAEMSRLGVTRLCLHTASKLAPLIRFYYEHGFYIDSTTKNEGYIRAFLVKEYDHSSPNPNAF